MFSSHLSSSNSPHRYEEDSFEAQQLSKHLPRSEPKHYELTFKKHQDDSYFRQPSNHLSLLQTVGKPVDYYFRCGLEQLSSLPFAELYQMQLSPLIEYKLKLIGQLLEVKRTRSKIASIDINLRCLRTKQSQSFEDKNRIFLLDLLWQQLTKKIFVQALKLNVTHSRYLRIEQDNDISKEAIRVQPHQISQQFEQQQENNDAGEDSNHLWQQKSDSQSEEEHQFSGKLIILTQIVSSIIKRILFSSFNTLKHHKSKLLSSRKMNLHQQEEQQEQQQQWNNNEERYDQEEQERRQESLTQNRLEELYSYIEQLHEECAKTNNILKKYFIKWKIYLLEGVAESIARQISDYREDPTPRTQLQRQKMVQHLQADSLSDQIESRIITQSSQGINSLRHEKSQLKEFIRRRASFKFLNNLRDYKQLQQINSVCLSMRKEYIVSRVFKVFKQIWLDGRDMKEMEDYYQQMSESQFEDDGTSKLFHKTNLLYRYFRAIVDYRRDQKMARTLQYSQMKLCLRTIHIYAMRQKKISETIDRREISEARRLIFRYFRLWKQAHQLEQPYLEKLKKYLVLKKKQKLRLYFSSLKYAYKQGILSQKLAEKYYKQKKKQLILREWSYLAQQQHQLRQKEALVREKRRQFESYNVISRLRQFYIDIVDYQRMGVKQQKLRRMIIKLQALKGIKQWRQNNLRKKTYQAIQLKLTRLTQKQRKRQILHQWLDRVRDKSKDSSPQSQKHKNWLVNYYGSLCSAQPR